MRRFAFLIHPLELDGYADFDPSIKALPAAGRETLVSILHGLADPLVVSDSEIISPDGARAFGEFILVSKTAEELKAMPHDEAVALISEAAELGRQRGAELVGLGAFTSIVTHGGLALRDLGIPVTSGNSFTVAAALEAIDESGRSHQRAAIVGAAGAIGRAVSCRLMGKVAQMTLVGNPKRSAEALESQLREVVAEAADYWRNAEADPAPGSIAELLRNADLESLLQAGRITFTADAAEAARSADLLVTASSATGALIAAQDLPHGATVCEVSRPFNLAAEIESKRPDLQLIRGGVVEVPGLPHLGDFGLERGQAFACMAETMLLALEGERQHFSLGARLSMVEVDRLSALARKHDFHPVLPAPLANRSTQSAN
jgi:predicted amino acid dehydrogenase